MHIPHTDFPVINGLFTLASRRYGKYG